MRVPLFADFEHYIQWQVQTKVYRPLQAVEPGTKNKNDTMEARLRTLDNVTFNSAPIS